MSTWRAALVNVQKAMRQNPGSIYVSVYMTRKQAEALVRKLEKPHLFPAERYQQGVMTLAEARQIAKDAGL